MEPDGQTRIWQNMNDPQLYDSDGVVEVFPKSGHAFYDAITGDEAEEIRSQVDVAYEVGNEFNPRYHTSGGPIRAYWIDLTVVATGEQIRIDNVRPYNSEIMARVLSTVEEKLGRTGLTIIANLHISEDVPPQAP